MQYAEWSSQPEAVVDVPPPTTCLKSTLLVDNRRRTWTAITELSPSTSAPMRRRFCPKNRAPPATVRNVASTSTEPKSWTPRATGDAESEQHVVSYSPIPCYRKRTNSMPSLFSIPAHHLPRCCAACTVYAIYYYITIVIYIAKRTCFVCSYAPPTSAQRMPDRCI